MPRPCPLPNDPIEPRLDVEALFDAHADALFRTIRRLSGSDEIAEDVVQDVFALVHARRDALDDRVGIRTWLYRAAINVLRHQRRSESRFRRALERLWGEPVAPSVAPDARIEGLDDARRVSAAVLALSALQREVFVLYELEELEGAEIAEILQIPVNTVWSRLRLARAAFREHLLSTHPEAR